jgi:hypothetical protein
VRVNAEFWAIESLAKVGRTAVEDKAPLLRVGRSGRGIEVLQQDGAAGILVGHQRLMLQNLGINGVAPKRLGSGHFPGRGGRRRSWTHTGQASKLLLGEAVATVSVEPLEEAFDEIGTVAQASLAQGREPAELLLAHLSIAIAVELLEAVSEAGGELLRLCRGHEASNHN